MAKMMAPNQSIYFVDITATFDPLIPLASDLTTALGGTPKAWNLSRGIATGYTLNATASDTDDSRTIVDEANAKSRGYGNYEASLPFYREKLPLVNTTSAFKIAFDLFKDKGKTGYLVKRLGYKNSVALAAGQKVSIYGVESLTPRDQSSDSGGPLQFIVPFNPTGTLVVNIALG